MQKEVRIDSIKAGEHFYFAGDKYKLSSVSMFDRYRLGICLLYLTIKVFHNDTKVTIDCKKVRLKELNRGDEFVIGSEKTCYTLSDSRNGSLRDVIFDKYKIRRFDDNIEVYPIKD